MQLRALCGLGVARLVVLPPLGLSKSETLCTQGQDIATGRSPGAPLLCSSKAKGAFRKPTGAGVGAVLAVGSRVEFRHGPEPLEARLHSLSLSGDAELAELLPSPATGNEWDLLVSEMESSDSEAEVPGSAGTAGKASISPERALTNKVSARANVLFRSPFKLFLFTDIILNNLIVTR